MNGKPKKFVHFAVSPTISSAISPKVIAYKDILYEFPNQLKCFEEIFILCDSSGIQKGDPRESNLGLMVIKCKESKFHIYPQEWFNKGKFDFDYQWVTKIGREPTSGEIVGEGVRIGSFVLSKDYSGIKNAF